MNEAELNGGGEGEADEVYSGLRTQDLQEAKDQLLVETSDMLHIPLFTAEALLRDNGKFQEIDLIILDLWWIGVFLIVVLISAEWSRESLLDKWMKDPVHCCQSAGVQPPPSALEGGSGTFCLSRPLRSPSVVEESNSCDEQETEVGSASNDSSKSPARRGFHAPGDNALENQEMEVFVVSVKFLNFISVV